MGDTLLQLDSPDAVRRLLVEAGDALSAMGHLVLGLRDLSDPALTGTRQILPVRGDDTRVLTCMLEFEPEAVQVTDMLHTRGDDGWTLAVGSYRKLRLSLEWMREAIAAAQLSLIAEAGENGVLTFVARR